MGNTQEFSGVTLGKTAIMVIGVGNMEPELLIFCNKERLLMQGMGSIWLGEKVTCGFRGAYGLGDG